MFDGKLVPQQKQPPEYSMKKGGLGNFTKFTGKNLCQSLFFNKVAGLCPATLLKKRLWHRCFPVNFVKFPRTFILQNTSGRLLLSSNQCYILLSLQLVDGLFFLITDKALSFVTFYMILFLICLVLSNISLPIRLDIEAAIHSFATD